VHDGERKNSFCLGENVRGAAMFFPWRNVSPAIAQTRRTGSRKLMGGKNCLRARGVTTQACTDLKKREREGKDIEEKKQSIRIRE